MGPCVPADVLVVPLECLPGLWLFLIGGFGKIQMTQIIRLAIYLHKVGNADVKCHKIQFSNKCCFFVSFYHYYYL